MESPTHVGNTGTGSHAAASRSVHPHACGEYKRIRAENWMQDGSSPRVWGIPVIEESSIYPARFIPTRVGNTCRRRAHRPGPPVHPHACGEYPLSIWRVSSSGGSSPRVWGIHKPIRTLILDERFIPTRVGNTLCPLSRLMPQPVHPHACGEYSLPTPPLMRATGSSPRVWGILFRKMQEITDCWQSSSVLPSHACCKPAPMTIKRGRSFVKRLLPLVKNCPAGQSRSLDVTCPDRRNARLRS